MRRVYVGNVSYYATEAHIRALFQAAGFHVTAVNIVKDKFTKRSKGFAFVDLETEEEAARALTRMDGLSLEGRLIVVGKAFQKETPAVWHFPEDAQNDNEDYDAVWRDCV